MRWTVGALAVGLAGCGGIEAYEVPPAEGTWRFEMLERHEDACLASEARADALLRPTVESVFVTADEGGFWLALGAGGDAACVQDGGAFECKPAVERVRVNDDATVSGALIASGWLSDDGATMEGEFVYDFLCNGADCMQVEQSWGVTAPCRTAGTFRATPLAADVPAE